MKSEEKWALKVFSSSYQEQAPGVEEIKRLEKEFNHEIITCLGVIRIKSFSFFFRVTFFDIGVVKMRLKTDGEWRSASHSR